MAENDGKKCEDEEHTEPVADSCELVADLHVLFEDNGHLGGQLQEFVVSPEPEDLEGAHESEEDAHEEEDAGSVQP